MGLKLCVWSTLTDPSPSTAKESATLPSLTDPSPSTAKESATLPSLGEFSSELLNPFAFAH
jgi:hypothetical protein